jgi:hypothetical protein
MALTIDQLRSGIRYWRSKAPQNWPQDFHNRFYEYDLALVRANGLFNEQWWSQFYPILQDWKATRPWTRAALTERAQERFQALGERWAVAIAPYLGNDIAGLEWRQIAPFPLLVAEIKPLKVPKPAFTAKFCHFLAPRIFPVIDTEAMGSPYPTYEKYFEAAREEWLRTDTATQDRLIALLTEAVGAPLFSGFPMKSKLIEICIIGRR